MDTSVYFEQLINHPNYSLNLKRKQNNMDRNDPNYLEMPLDELKRLIQTVTDDSLNNNIDNKKYIIELADAIISYVNRIQTENNYSIVFPVELLPASKSDLRKWGFKYSIILLRKFGSLKKYHQDMILCFTRFQPISPAQWEELKNDENVNISVYYKDMRDKGSSTNELKLEYKKIVDNYINEYNEGAKDLLAYLKNHKSQRIGCLRSVIYFFTIGLGITMILFLFIIFGFRI
jgi:hypothetical protein